MNAEHFWELIDESRSRSSGDPELQAKILTRGLAQMDGTEILDFEKHLMHQLWCIHDARLMAASAMLDDMDDDDFQDFGLWLISQGRSTFNACLEDPEALAEIIELGDRIKSPEFAAISRDAYKQKTGLDDFDSQLADEPPLELRNADFVWQTKEGYPDPTRLRRLFPKLWAKWGQRFE